MYSLFLLFCCSDTNTPRPCSTNAIGASHRLPLPATPQEPMVALPFRRLLTSVPPSHSRPTPVPPPSHPRPIQSIRPIQPVSNHTAHKSQFLLANPIPIPIQSSRYNPVNTIQTIQPILSSQRLLWRETPNSTKPNQKDPSSVTSASDFSPSPASHRAILGGNL